MINPQHIMTEPQHIITNPQYIMTNPQHIINTVTQDSKGVPFVGIHIYFFFM